MPELEKQGLLVPRNEEYKQLLGRVSRLIEESRKTAVRQINATLVANYWLTGQEIVEHELKGRIRAEYGQAMLMTLSIDLTNRYGKGYGYSNLNLMRQFYLAYPSRKILQTASGESGRTLPRTDFLTAQSAISKVLPLSWSQYCILIRISDLPKRDFYESLCCREGWVVRQLDREIRAMLYERTALSRRKDLVLKKARENPIVSRPEDEIKDTYVLEFLNLKDEYSETDLEDAMIQHMERFLLEIGYGFTFVARQKRFNLDGDDYRIDLILYSIPLARYVILEIKNSRFSHAHAGQINFYLNWAKDHLLPKAENDPLGIILCSDKHGACVKYAMGGMSNKIFVSKYLLKLPKTDELQKELERGRDLFLQRQASQNTSVKKETDVA
ncbi:MAG: PDDEXK nuclease domain-containing protein [Candidatus Omnitrophota bacterium]